MVGFAVVLVLYVLCEEPGQWSCGLPCLPLSPGQAWQKQAVIWSPTEIYKRICVGVAKVKPVAGPETAGELWGLRLATSSL